MLYRERVVYVRPLICSQQSCMCVLCTCTHRRVHNNIRRGHDFVALLNERIPCMWVCFASTRYCLIHRSLSLASVSSSHGPFPQSSRFPQEPSGSLGLGPIWGTRTSRPVCPELVFHKNHCQEFLHFLLCEKYRFWRKFTTDTVVQNLPLAFSGVRWHWSTTFQTTMTVSTHIVNSETRDFRLSGS